MSGIVSGGWEFVWAAYGITLTTLAFYGFRLAKQVRKDDEESRDA